MSYEHQRIGTGCGYDVAKTIADALGASYAEINRVSIKKTECPASAWGYDEDDNLYRYEIGDWIIQEYDKFVDCDCDGVSVINCVRWRKDGEAPAIPETQYLNRWDDEDLPSYDDEYFPDYGVTESNNYD